MRTVMATCVAVCAQVAGFCSSTASANSAFATDSSCFIQDLTPSHMMIHSCTAAGGLAQIDVSTQNLATSTFFQSILISVSQLDQRLTIASGRIIANISGNTAVELNGGTGNIMAVIDGVVRGLVNVTTHSGTVSVSGTGSAERFHFQSYSGPVTLFGMNGGIKDEISAFVGHAASTGAPPSLDIAVSGPVAGPIHVEAIANANGQTGPVNISVVNVSAAGGAAAIQSNNVTGATVIAAAGTIESVSAPITADASSGAISINGLGSGKVSGGYWGAVATDRPAFGGGGAREIKNFQSIAATNIGAAVQTAGGIASVTGNGAITVTNTNTSNGPNMLFGSGTESFGIAALNTSGPTVINQNGAIYSDDWGIKATANGGSIAINGNNTVTAKRRTGIRAETGGGAISMIGNQAVTGQESGVVAWNLGLSGDVVIDGNAAMTGNSDRGLQAQARGGDIRIGQTAGNGVISGLLYGVLATNTSGANRIRLTNLATSMGAGLHSNTSTGNQTIIVAAPNGRVEGAYLGMGIVTTTGVATVENFGMITQKGDPGSVTSIGGTAYNQMFGKSIINNRRGLIGSIKTSGTQFSMFNHPSGFWLPATQAVPSSFNTPNDSVHNKGTIRLRNGVTLFGQLEKLMNWSGGLIDLQMAPGGDETLLVGNFQPMNGGKLRLEANFAAPHGTGDQTSFGTGSADTIEVAAGGLVTPAGVTQVDLLFTGVPVLNLLGTSGSLALVRSAAPALPDPGLGGISTLVPSLHYAFVADPSLKKLKFVLQDDGAGGVYLRWAPVP